MIAPPIKRIHERNSSLFSYTSITLAPLGFKSLYTVSQLLKRP